MKITYNVNENCNNGNNRKGIITVMSYNDDNEDNTGHHNGHCSSFSLINNTNDQNHKGIPTIRKIIIMERIMIVKM